MLFRCKLPKLALFNFEASPVLDLRVIPTKEDCIVELFSCKFKVQMLWNAKMTIFQGKAAYIRPAPIYSQDPCALEVDVKLNLCLENIHLYMFLPSKRQAQVVSYLCKQNVDVGAAAMDGMGAIHFAA
ncbi:hypothetical protein GOBAR_AA27110 [Gossypium barbadense]|uniref:Uncharacterized protein n=1 Tax=Gossypium barbadense TaxID=3634 RepID=A0A2P5RBB6_GOSBA|nr:hypothetical protein GOBAR_DD19001 [Gossypium barbadense]PPR93561.1 hypothetical protein GOBAR_AA27110 [Gossypium barbadense]